MKDDKSKSEVNIIFAIALRSQGSTDNWKNVTENFNNTLKSIFNQTNPNFLVYVGCNEIPELYEPYDERLQFFQVANPVPKEWLEMARDKFWKYSVVAQKIRDYLLETSNPGNGVFVLPMDADDYVHNQICEYVGSHNEANGFVSEYGYVFYHKNNRLIKYNQMHTLCGSCNIIKMYLDDLPSELPAPELCFDKETAGVLNSRYPIRWDYHILVEKYKDLGKSFSILPFPSTIYYLGNGDNISAIYSLEHASKATIMKRIRSVASKIKHYPERRKSLVKITPEIRESFAFYQGKK